MKDDFVIGVLGGMGTYATIQLFKQYAEVFPAEKEWDRPRIVIDNRCTMPSRVLAYLKHIKEDELVEQMSDSMRHLIDTGATKILLACNTSHLFLPRIYENVPEAFGTVWYSELNDIRRDFKNIFAKLDVLNIPEERKKEIDNILKETYEKYKNGEIKKHSLNEFLSRREKRIEELKK